MQAKYLRIALFTLAGIAVGVMFAGFKTRDFRHAMLVIKKDMVAKPLHISSAKGRQVLALSLKNLQSSRDIEIRMNNAAVQSWYPPVVRMPFTRWMEVEGGLFKGVDFGKRLPLYLIVDGSSDCNEMEIIDSSRGALIQTVQIIRGGYDGGNH